MSNDFLPHFRNSKLGLQALTDPSYVNENPGCGEDNERLEYLGDRILNSIVSHSLYVRYPHRQEGPLTQILSTWVST
jgi:ribonuclease-3